jgi:hypothetical protein
MESGDLLLFPWSGWFSYFTYLFGSKYTHAGIYIKDPHSLNQDLPDGDYILHTTFMNGIYDIHLERLDQAILCYGQPDYKKIHAPRNKYFSTMLEELFRRFATRSFGEDLFDWLSRFDGDVHRSPEYYRYTQQFWSSALVSYVYKQIGWIRSLDWGMVSPSGLDGDCLVWRFPSERPRRLE